MLQISPFITSPPQEGIPTVLELLNARKDGEQDQYRLALAVQGGALRATTSAGMLIALHDLGYAHELFDEIYGVSMGALNAAYYILEEVQAVELYLGDYIKKIFQPRNMLRGRPMFDLDYLLNAIAEDFPIEISRIPPGKLRIIVSDMHQVEPHVVDTFSSNEDFLRTLRAALSRPLYSGKSRPHNGTHHADGNILTAHPIYSAVNHGATHILSLSTEPATKLRKPAIFGDTRGLSGKRQVKQTLRIKSSEYLMLPARIAEGDVALNGTQILDVRPTAPFPQATRKSHVLREGVKNGYGSMFETLTGDPRQVPEPYAIPGPES